MSDKSKLDAQSTNGTVAMSYVTQDGGQGTVTECVVFSVEINEEISKRRTAIFQAEGRQGQDTTLLGTCPADIKKELVGLSLSGGGVRSASFSVGLLQAFGSSGLMKYVDYLSTVSGGGYTGALFSSLSLGSADNAPDKLWHRLNPFARDGECKYDRESCPRVEACPLRLHSAPELVNGESVECRREVKQSSDNRDQDQQSKLVQRLAYGGDYLFRSKAEFASKFVTGFVLNNIVLLSGLISVCALIAWSWRWLDYPSFGYRFIKPIDELTVLKWKWWSFSSDSMRPFLPLFVLLPLWLLTWPATKLVSYRWAAILRRVMFAAVIASGLIGIAVVLGNRDVGGSSRFWDWQNSIYPWLVLAGGLLPFVRPKLLMESAVQPKNQMQTYAFMIASTTLLVGVPLFGIFWMAREDFARSSKSRTDISHRDLITPDRLRNLATGLLTNESIVNVLPFTAIGSYSPGPPAAVAVVIDPAIWRNEFAHLTTSDPSNALASEEKERLQSIANQVERDFRPAVAAAYRSSVQKDTNITDADLTDEQKRDLELDKLATAVSTLISSPTDGGDTPEVLPGKLKSEPSPEDFLKAAQLQAIPQLSSEWAELDEPERQRFLQYYNDRFLKSEEPRLRELLARYQRYGANKSVVAEASPADFRKPLSADELKELNRLLLNAWYPAYFHTRAFISTPVALQDDQPKRFKWFVGAGLVCLIAAYLVSPNATSVQGYYRDRLTDNFVEPTEQDRSEIRLAHLNTCSRGAPYHLISGTATLKTLRSALGLRDPDAAHDLEVFLFSKLYCGSRTLQYAPTGLCLPNDYDTLGNAIAVSGAAVSPDAVNNLLLRAVMTILNLRQGQWLPNPSESKTSLRDGHYSYWRPNYLWLLLDLWQSCRKQRLCFVTDGGHRENLGLVQLLLRRCRLIIASDAGCDPTHRYDSLAKVLRICDMHLGIRFEEIKLPPIKTAEANANPMDYGPDLQSEPLDLYSAKRTVTENVAGTNSTPEVCSSRERCEALLVERHYLLTRIIYPDPDIPDGLLVYLKPSLTGDESEAIENYRAQNCGFPHESTSDQDYDPAQFMSYVMLGRHIGEEIANLFSPRSIGVGTAKNWWRTSAVSVDRLVNPYLNPEQREAEEWPAAQSEDTSEPATVKQAQTQESQPNQHKVHKYAERIDVIKDETKDYEARAKAIDNLVHSELARSNDIDEVSTLQSEIDPIVQRLCKIACEPASNKDAVDDECIKMLKSFGPWALISLSRMLRSTPPSRKLVELFALLLLPFEVESTWRSRLEREFAELHKATLAWPAPLRKTLNEEIWHKLAKTLDKAVVLKAVSNE